MYRDLRQQFWWDGLKRDVTEWVKKCLTCQKVKIEHRGPAGLLQPLDIPDWKWESISMDFVVGLPVTRKKNNCIWVIVDRLTKTARFIPMRDTWSMAQLADAYVREVGRHHGVPKTIISDRDSRFTSKFWSRVQEAFGTILRFSSAFHPATDGQTERTNQTMEDMLRGCALDFQGSWEEALPYVEFSYNNSFHTSIGMAPYEALYGRKCRSPLYWCDPVEKVQLGPDFVKDSLEVVQLVQSRIKAAQDRQKSYADGKRRNLEFEVGDKVLLKVSPMRGVMRFGNKGKLAPRYVGPYDIVDKLGEVAYRLALPPALSKIHPVFHISQLRKYVSDPSHVLQSEIIELDPDLSFEEQAVKILDYSTRKTRNSEVKLVKVLWNNHGVEEASWELESEIRQKYPSLFRYAKFRGRNFS